MKLFLLLLKILLYFWFSVIHRLPTRDADYLVITDVLEFIHPLTVIEQHVTCHLLNRLVFYLGDAHFYRGERKLAAGFIFPSNSVFIPTYLQYFAPYRIWGFSGGYFKIKSAHFPNVTNVYFLRLV